MRNLGQDRLGRFLALLAYVSDMAGRVQRRCIAARYPAPGRVVAAVVDVGRAATARHVGQVAAARSEVVPVRVGGRDPRPRRVPPSRYGHEGIVRLYEYMSWPRTHRRPVPDPVRACRLCRCGESGAGTPVEPPRHPDRTGYRVRTDRTLLTVARARG